MVLFFNKFMNSFQLTFARHIKKIAQFEEISLKRSSDLTIGCGVIKIYYYVSISLKQVYQFMAKVNGHDINMVNEREEAGESYI